MKKILLESIIVGNSHNFISGWLLCFCWLDHDKILLENSSYLIHQLGTNKWRVWRILEAIYTIYRIQTDTSSILSSSASLGYMIKKWSFWDRKWKSTIISWDSLFCFVPTEWKWCYQNISLHCREKTIEPRDRNVLFFRIKTNIFLESEFAFDVFEVSN